MPRWHDLDAIRNELRSDPVWALYALADLAPRAFSKTRWFGPPVALVYKGFEPAILFAMAPGAVPEAIHAEGLPLQIQLKPDALAAASRYGTAVRCRRMWRMGWKGAPDGMPSRGDAIRLNGTHIAALQDLYADGAATAEAPDAFCDAMVDEGIFFGIFSGARLIAAAGTHIVSPEEGIAAIGNVYTRGDCRGRGLAKLTVSAVLDALSGVDTIGLNVRQDNPAAIRVYESLGFRKHCEFFEGLLVSS